ncbi:MAG: extracellular solute-binding protein [Candidatus Magasanikbacteria bacterium]
MKIHLPKILILALLLSSTVIFGFGCKGMSTTEKQATKAVSLEYWTVYDDVDALRTLAAQYRQARPYLTINIKQLRAEELYQKLIEELADDRGPDIISINNRELRKFYTKLAPMPSSVQDTTVTVTKTTIGTDTTVNIGTVNLPTTDQLDKEYVQTVKKDVVIGGRIYGLPVSLDTMALYYNKDLLDKAGIPEPPDTWEKFSEAVKKITRYNKDTNKVTQSGTALGTGNNIPGFDDILYLLFDQSNVPFVSNNGQVVFSGGGDSSGAAMDILSFYTDFANPTRDTYSWNESMSPALDQFVNGSVGFFFGYSYHLPVIRGRAPQLNFGILPMLQLSTDAILAKNVANYSVQTVVAKSKDQNEAWAFINYLTRSQANGEYLEKTKRPAALRAYIAKQKTNSDLQPFVDQILVASNWYRGRNYASAQQALKDLLHDWLNPPANLEERKANQWRQDLLNIAANKINQTL